MCTIFTSKFGHYSILYNNNIIWNNGYSLKCFVQRLWHFCSPSPLYLVPDEFSVSRGNSDGFFGDKECVGLEMRRSRKATDKLVVQFA